MRNSVTQEDTYGCGVACTAFLLNKTYQETKKLFDIKKVEEYGCDCPDISKVLNENGLKYRWGKYEGGEVPNGSVIYLGKSKQFKVGHWLVKYGNQWMNPWVKGWTIKEAQAEFQNELPEKNIEWCVYPEESK